MNKSIILEPFVASGKILVKILFLNEDKSNEDELFM